jgi:hypothetical protein
MFFGLIFSLERDETGGVSRTNTRTTVLDRLVGDRELSQVVADHLRLDLNLVEGLAVVHTNDTSDHLWNNNHVPQVCPNHLRLLTCWGILFLNDFNRKGTEVVTLHGLKLESLQLK